MFTRIEALNYRCLRCVSQDLDPFHVLVGPNASGKTTFLDVPAFLSDLLNDGLEEAVRRRSSDPRDLLHFGRGDRFTLIVMASTREADDVVRVGGHRTAVRYEVRIHVDPHTSEPKIEKESLKVLEERVREEPLRHGFPDAREPSDEGADTHEGAIVVSRHSNGNAVFIPEPGTEHRVADAERDAGYDLRRQASDWIPEFRFGAMKSALANLPEDEVAFPVANWFKGRLRDAVQRMELDGHAMRRPSPPGQPTRFKPDGTNLPWVVEHLKTRHPEAFADWLAHLRVGLPEIEDIDTVLREEDRHRYLRIAYAGGDGFKVPSWMVSDGTLRLIALTVAAYLPDLRGCLLIEEPENGIHPKALETMYQSLSHVYDAQVLTATHSPMILSLADPARVLCFAKDESGATDIVRGDRHPMLVDWQKDVSLGTLFAAGVLG